LSRNALRFKRRLLAWFRSRGRPLPWRETRDPYRVLVSEFMLQQTQVARAEQYYLRFLRRFPTVEALARARPATVRAAWDGLGYYRRAANLHRLARRVVREHDGNIPQDPADLARLPGVGRYTAGAVASFAYERRVAAVDTNVARVLRRAFRRPDPDGRVGEDKLWRLAERLLPARRKTTWEFNQALMDLGATICVARTPKCHECPVQPACNTGRRAT
ncbi:MAG: A/G-specific adenine glycosylase, partial [Gemmatimonadales bacterium]